VATTAATAPNLRRADRPTEAVARPATAAADTAEAKRAVVKVAEAKRAEAKVAEVNRAEEAGP
jgi:hypothetical protein